MTTTTLYVSRRVRVPPFAAAVALDDLFAATSEGRLPCPVVAPSAVLALRAPCLANERGPLLPLRTGIGRLRPARGWCSFEVEVDLSPWSRRQAEVGIRPVGRFPPRSDGGRQQRFVRLADAMTVALASRLEAIATAWEHDVVFEAAALVRTAVGI
jgi:hypothetical protein